MYEKGKSDFEEELLKVLRQILLSKDAQDGFYCPFGKVSSSAMAELSHSLDDKREEIRRLQSEIEEWKNKTAHVNQLREEISDELDAQKKDNLRLVEDLKRLEAKLSSEEESYEIIREEVNDALANLDDLIKAREKVLSKALAEVAKQTEQSVKTSLQIEKPNSLSGFRLSKDLLLRIYRICEEYGNEQDKRINETRDRHSSIIMKVGNSVMLDGRIPMKFLNTAGILLRKAEQAVNDQKKDLAAGYREAVEEIDMTVDRLLEDQETNKMLQALKGRL